MPPNNKQTSHNKTTKLNYKRRGRGDREKGRGGREEREIGNEYTYMNENV